MVDWGIGEYEHTAAELAPVSEHVIALAAPQPGERLLDVACGTGNAALLAAGAGAEVTGLDAAPRLIDVARERAAAGGLRAEFAVGDAQALPFGDRAFDVVVSVFGVIFAPDTERAVGELLRVLAPDGRAVISAWVPAGPIDAMVGVFGRATARLTEQTPTRFPWSDREAVTALAARLGAQAAFHDAELTITAGSPEAYLADSETRHPMSLAGRPLLEGAGVYDAVRAEALAALEAGNEDPSAFRVRSPYRLIELRRTP